MEKIKVGDTFFTSMANICGPEIKYIDDLYKEYDGLYDPSKDSGIDLTELSNIEAYDKTLINSSSTNISDKLKGHIISDILIILKYVGNGNFEELTTGEIFGLVVPEPNEFELQDTALNDFVDVKLYHNAMEFAKDVDIIKKNPLKIFASDVSEEENKVIFWDADGVLYSTDGKGQITRECREQYLQKSDDERKEIIMEMKASASNVFNKQLQELVNKDQEIATLENQIIDFKSR